MFLLYINDIDENISSTVWLFADDYVMYRIIDSLEDSLCLQRDLSTILNWTKKWQMQLNIDKCVVLRCTRSTSPINYDQWRIQDGAFGANAPLWRSQP